MTKKSAEEDRRCSAWPDIHANLKEPKVSPTKGFQCRVPKVVPDVDAALRCGATDRDHRRDGGLVVGKGLKRNVRQIVGESPARHERG